MDSKIAKEIISKDGGMMKHDDGTVIFTYWSMEQKEQAKGFLEGMEAEEIRGFVDLEKQFRNCKRSKAGDGLCCACSDQYFKALSVYKDAIKSGEIKRD